MTTCVNSYTMSTHSLEESCLPSADMPEQLAVSADVDRPLGTWEASRFNSISNPPWQI